MAHLEQVNQSTRNYYEDQSTTTMYNINPLNVQVPPNKNIESYSYQITKVTQRHSTATKAKPTDKVKEKRLQRFKPQVIRRDRGLGELTLPRTSFCVER